MKRNGIGFGDEDVRSYVCVWVYVCMGGSVNMCMYEGIYVWVTVCVCVCVYVCFYMYVSLLLICRGIKM